MRLRLDASAYAIWSSDGMVGFPHDLPITDELADDLLRWQEDYDASWDWFDGFHGSPPEASTHYCHDHFDRRGDALAQRLRAELGPEWAVVHDRLLRPAYFNRYRGY